MYTRYMLDAHTYTKFILIIVQIVFHTIPSLSNIDILRDSVPDLKISTRSVIVDTFNWLR